MRARILRRLIAPFNWHRDGYCRFPVLCMYDDMLIWELDGIDKRRATWRRAEVIPAEHRRSYSSVCH